ncbi:DUF1203 domain-containing protein [Pseudonocardia humida]|uniref:DUF1203 domain-containing protein n=1 Tax=Pseudonocardia humida TaxID=2800819 RepID=A0ABT0ZVE9_9PSEU|nr:DUF1203 domain-containing protein [Pseudonocardia humida]MCO1654633.1 DUF1203 domain-containing protein [Pseudonocardia humida]
MTTTARAATFTVHAIPAEELERVRRRGRDVAGNEPTPFGAAGSPLRCCLRRATAADEVVLISHAPLRERSPWREVGPVFVHARACPGYDERAGLPPEVRTGPRVLRGYRADGSLDYDAIRTVGAGEDIGPALDELLAVPGLREVHVRAAVEQCFTYLVRPASAVDG